MTGGVLAVDAATGMNLWLALAGLPNCHVFELGQYQERVRSAPT
jgi:hypothetical protein